MPTRRKHRFRTRALVYFRRFRIGLWSLVLLLLAGFIYLNEVGLPGFMKQPLLETLRSRGLDLQFSKLRLSLYRGLVADNVVVGPSSAGDQPSLSANRAIVRLDARSLARLQLQVNSIALAQGTFTLPISETGAPPRHLVVSNIQTDLRFLPGDQWALDNFRAGFAGAKIQLSGTITNASLLPRSKLFKSREPSEPGGLQRRLRTLADALEQTEFSTPPELVVELRGDATNVASLRARIHVTTSGAKTLWGDIANARLTLLLGPDSNTPSSHSVLTLDAGTARTRWAQATNLHLRIEGMSADLAHPLLSRANIALTSQAAQTPWASGTGLDVKIAIDPLPEKTNVLQGKLHLALENGLSRWANASGSRFSVQWQQSVTNAVPISGTATGQIALAQTKWGTASGLDISAAMSPNTPAPLSAPETLAGWTHLSPYSLGWKLAIDRFSSNNLVARSLAIDGSWQMPDLHLTNFSATISTGLLAGTATLNVQSRRATANLASTIDPEPVAPLLTAGARRWLSQFTWNAPPRASAQLALTLPAWTNSQPDWRAEVQPTLFLNGQFEVEGGGSYRGLTAESARSHFTYSNMCWHLPDLFVTRPEGSLQAEHRADDRSKAFYWQLTSTVNPLEASPLLGTNAQVIKKLFTITEPPLIQARVWGYMRQPEKTALAGKVTATNFTLRGESFSGVQTSVDLTNGLLRFIEPRVQRDGQRVSGEGVLVDLGAQRVYITNGFSTAEVMPVARAIGPAVARAIEPFSFQRPPTVHFDGIVALKGMAGTDLKFIVEGGPFHWMNFHVPKIAGNIHWHDMRLTLNNVHTDLYGGQAVGHANFQFRTREPAEYDFALTTTNTLLRPLMQDVFSATNQVEGVLNGALVVTRGTTDDWRRWNGYGSAHLRDGLIWDIPAFGAFSPLLNGISPGLGNSRASSASFSFAMTNGVLYSDDMDIRSSGMRLNYRGTVDLHTRLDARVEAELLRDVWVVGPLISTVFWPVSKMFEYKVTGTLGDPHLDPVYVVPKLISLPLQPFRILKGIFPETPDARTNAPPSKP